MISADHMVRLLCTESLNYSESFILNLPMYHSYPKKIIYPLVLTKMMKQNFLLFFGRGNGVSD